MAHARSPAFFPAVALAITVSASLPGSARPAVAQVLPEPTQNAAAGSRVFGARGCGDCHSIRGLGGGSAPDLARPGSPRSFYDLTAALWNHAPRIAALGGAGRSARLSSREAGDLAAFLYTVDYFDPPGNAGRGRDLFTEKRCVMCHQAGGVGGVVGPSLDFVGQYRSPIPVAATMWNHGPAMAEEMRARGIERPTFTGPELLDLVAFLESVAAARPVVSMAALPGVAGTGRRLFAEKRCGQCHGAAGGGGIGPSLVARAARGSLIDFAAAMWNKAPSMTREMAARGMVQPTLDGAEMAHIVAFLYSIRYFGEAGSAPRGRALVGEKGCASCHASGARGARAAPPLGQREYGTPAEVAAALYRHARVSDPAVPWPKLTGPEAADLTAWLLEASR